MTAIALISAAPCADAWPVPLFFDKNYNCSEELFRELDRKYPEAGAFDLVNKYIPNLEKRFQDSLETARRHLENPGFSVENRKYTVEKVMIVALQRFVTVAEARNQPELAGRFRQQIEELSKQEEALE